MSLAHMHLFMPHLISSLETLKSGLLLLKKRGGKHVANGLHKKECTNQALIRSHNRASVWVIVTEEIRDSFFLVSCVRDRRRCLHQVSYETSRGPFVICVRYIRILDKIVRNIRPEFCHFSCVFYSFQHFIWVDEAANCYSVLCSVHFHSFHP